jgi:hypothetical protein
MLYDCYSFDYTNIITSGGEYSIFTRGGKKFFFNFGQCYFFLKKKYTHTPWILKGYLVLLDFLDRLVFFIQEEWIRKKTKKESKIFPYWIIDFVWKMIFVAYFLQYYFDFVDLVENVFCSL